MTKKKNDADVIASLEARLTDLRLKKRIAEEKRKVEDRLKERVASRKEGERKKYVLGAYLMAALKESDSLPERLEVRFGERFDQWLLRASDRKIFGLDPLPTPNNDPSPVSTNNQTPKRVNLRVPLEQKESAKALGAKWDSEQKTWYVPEGVDPSPFTLNGWM